MSDNGPLSSTDCLAQHPAIFVPVLDDGPVGRFDCPRCTCRFDFSRMPRDAWPKALSTRIEPGRAPARGVPARPAGDRPGRPSAA
jgi:hypothetical protein